MIKQRFVHLRLHTEYSIVDGILRLPTLIQKAVMDHMVAIGISDQSNLYATIKFYQAARRAGLKPIIGADIWINLPQYTKQEKAPKRLTLLCQTQEGYKNLIALISKSYLQRTNLALPIVDAQWFNEHASGLIAIFDLAQEASNPALFTQQMSTAKYDLEQLSLCFANRLYLEVYRIGQEHAESLLGLIMTLADSYRLPLVATNAVCFLEKDDFEAHEARVCIQTSRILNDTTRPRLYTNQQYFRSQAEMCDLFSDIPVALKNSVEIAKRCNLTISLGQPLLPHFVVSPGESASNVLYQTAMTGLNQRLMKKNIQRTIYDERLVHELNVINKMGFADYFLIVADFTKWAKEHDIPVGPGRGSGPGSLVAYALNITDIDPLEHDLLFERFLNPERISMPDFDIDFCIKGRDRVIEYVMQKHGASSVAQIITYGTMAARAVIRDVGRVLGLHYGFVDKIAKLIPFELGMTLEKALQQEPLLKERYEQEDDIRLLIDLAKKLEGVARNIGTHAGGIVIAPSQLTDFIPIYCEPTDTAHSVTQFDKDDIETIGLVKFDFLGLKTLTIIDDTLKQINKERALKKEVPIDIHTIPLNDEKTFALLKACQSIAIFQVESHGMRDLIKRLQPDCFEDLIALVALFRPGPLQSGMVDDFVNRKHGRSKVIYPHQRLIPILKTTYGVILYQEQVMQIAQVLAGYTLGSADILRHAMGKKKSYEMAKQRKIFLKGAIVQHVDPDLANAIFDLMEKFAGYGFNKSHSVSYALITYQTAWLKAHYPAMFMAAVFTADMDRTDKILILMRECKQLHLNVLSPNINQSDYSFKVLNEQQLLFGLGAIKGLGKAAIESIIEARQCGGIFSDFFDFCARIDLSKVNRRALEALIKSGCFDDLDAHRASLFATITPALQQAEQARSNQKYGQQDLLADDEANNRLFYINTPMWDQDTQLIGEKETLGFYLSGHPFDYYKEELKQMTTALDTIQHESLNTIKVAGMISNLRVRQTKRGNQMATFLIDDGSQQVDCVCFAESYQKYRALLSEDRLIIMDGKVHLDEMTESARFVCYHIFCIEDIRKQYAKAINIQLQNLEQVDWDAFHHLLQTHRINSIQDTLAIEMTYAHHDTQVKIRLGKSWRLPTSDAILKTLQHELRDGVKKIAVEYSDQ